MRTSETFYTSVVDAVIWSFCLVGTLALVLVGGDLVADLVKGTLASVRRPSFNVAVWMALAAFGCGLLFFGFGWLGRVTLSPEGMSAPRYSGARDFLRWSEIRSARPGNLSGWPCTLVSGGQPERVLYIMVIGSEKKRLIDRIAHFAGNDNTLVRYFVDRSV